MSENHEKNDAKIYCGKWKIYMCNKCEVMHANLFPTHQIFNLEKPIENIFTGFCLEEDKIIMIY